MAVVPAVVLQLSDVHLTAAPGGPLHGVDPDARLAAVLDAWRRRAVPTDLVLVTGDDSDDGAPGAYERLAAALATTGVPSLVLAGNHDDGAALRTVFGPPAPRELGGWRIVPVDSTLPDRIHGVLDAAALAAELDRLDRRPTVVAIHHPPRSPSTHPMFRLEGADGLLAAIAARPHVRAVVSGHLHQPFEYVADHGALLLGAPSTFEAIDHAGDRYVVPGSCPTGARILHLGDDGEVRSELLVG